MATYFLLLRIHTLFLVLLVSTATAQVGGAISTSATPKPTIVQRLAFGSCANQRISQPIWDSIAAQKPQVFVFLGDNMYADTDNMDSMRAQYGRLAAQPGYKKLRRTTKVFATWDDHDYGQNDAGHDYPKKEESEVQFEEFFFLPKEARTRPGIYHTQWVEGPNKEKVQLLLLDERYFRTRPIAQGPREKGGANGNYIPDTAGIMLGEAQWKWLAAELAKPADIRLLCSSTQVVSEFNGWELWALYPKEKARLLAMLDTTKGRSLVLSGDVHIGEISRQTLPSGDTLWDITSSGLTEVWPKTPDNRYRVGEAVRERNFGLLVFDWKKRQIALQIRDEKGKILQEHQVGF